MRLAISDVASRIGLQPSAIRYYERIGILPHPERVGGQRKYDESVLQKLAVVQCARRVGFTLEEIRLLFFGFKNGTPASQRWQKLSRKKLTEIDVLMRETRAVKRLLEDMMEKCHCVTLEQCGSGILRSDSDRPVVAPFRRMNRK